MTQFGKKKGVKRMVVKLNDVEFNIVIDQTNNWITVERVDEQKISASNLILGKINDDYVYSTETPRLFIQTE